MKKPVIYVIGLGCLVVALLLSPFQPRPTLAIIEVMLLILTYPLFSYSRRIHNAWPLLIAFSMILGILAVRNQNHVKYSLEGLHSFLGYFEALSAIACAVAAIFEAIRAWRQSGAPPSAKP